MNINNYQYNLYHFISNDQYNLRQWSRAESTGHESESESEYNIIQLECHER